MLTVSGRSNETNGVSANKATKVILKALKR